MRFPLAVLKADFTVCPGLATGTIVSDGVNFQLYQRPRRLTLPGFSAGRIADSMARGGFAPWPLR